LWVVSVCFERGVTVSVVWILYILWISLWYLVRVDRVILNLRLLEERLIQRLFFASFAYATYCQNNDEDDEQSNRDICISVAVPLTYVVLVVGLIIILSIKSVVMVIAPCAAVVIQAIVGIQTVTTFLAV